MFKANISNLHDNSLGMCVVSIPIFVTFSLVWRHARLPLNPKHKINMCCSYLAHKHSERRFHNKNPWNVVPLLYKCLAAILTMFELESGAQTFPVCVRIMQTKQNDCAQRRLRSAWASAQSHQVFAVRSVGS